MGHVYTLADLERLWINAGGPKQVAPVMAAIALAESGGNPTAKNVNKNGTVDRGLWQINSVHGYGTKSFDPIANAREAVSVYHSQGLNAWTTYRNGAWKQKLFGSSVSGAGLLKGVAGATAGALGGNPKDNPGTQAHDAITGWVGELTHWAEGAALRALAYLVLTVAAIILFVFGLERTLGATPLTRGGMLPTARPDPEGIPY